MHSQCALSLPFAQAAWFWHFPASRLEAGLYGYNGCLVGLAMATFSPLMRWPAFVWATQSIVVDASFAPPAGAPPPPPFALSDRDAGLLLVAVVVAVAAFGALSALVQEALINSLRRHLKVTSAIRFWPSGCFQDIVFAGSALVCTHSFRAGRVYLSSLYPRAAAHVYARL
jgi:hypothetical protein